MTTYSVPRKFNAATDRPLIAEASRLLEANGFEHFMGSMTSTPFTGDVPAYDSNFGSDYDLPLQDLTTYASRMAMTPEELTAYHDSFKGKHLTLTLNYISAPDIIAALS